MLQAAASATRLSLVTGPAAELFSSADAVVQQMIKPDTSAQDTYLDLILAASRQLFEEETGLVLITQTWQAEFDKVPLSPTGRPHRIVSLGRAPLVALSSATYLDTAGASQSFTLSGNLVAANVGHRQSFGLAALEHDADWPDLGEYPGALRIQFTAGFGAAAANVPQTMRLAVLQLAAWWYEQRLPVNVGNIANQVPLHLQRILNLHRVTG